MQKQTNSFKFKQQKISTNLTQITPNSQIRFWKRFFSKKTVIFSIIILSIILLFLCISAMWNPYSMTQPINDSMNLNHNIKPLVNPTVHLTIDPSLEQAKAFIRMSQTYPEIIKISSIADKNLVEIVYNPYDLMNKLNSTKFLFQHLLGTNKDGVDIYSRVIYSEGVLFAIAIISILISLPTAVFLAICVAIYIKKPFNNFISKLFGSFSIIPYLLMSLIFFSVFRNTFWNSIIIFIIISFTNLFVGSYNNTIELLNQEAFKADKTLGYNNWKLITKSLFMNVLNYQIIQAIEQISMIFLSYTAVALFSLNNNSGVNLGVVIKEAIDLFDSNWQYLITLIILTTGISFSIKIIAWGLNDSYNVKGALHE